MRYDKVRVCSHQTDLAIVELPAANCLPRDPVDLGNDARNPAGRFSQNGVGADNLHYTPRDPVIPEKHKGQLKDFVFVRTQPRCFHVENDGSSERPRLFGHGGFCF